MSRESALETLAEFRKRLSKLQGVLPNSNWEVEWRILRNDVDEWIKSTFATDSTEYREVKKVLFPGPVIIGAFSDEYRYFLGQAKRLLQSFALVEHRLQQGQAALKDEEPELVVEAGKPYTAYVKLRDIIEIAKQSITLVDPYVDRSLYQLLSNCPSSIHVRVLTRQAKMPGDFITEGSKFEKETGIKTEVRAGLDDFHDRLLIVDGKLFLSGASFKDLGGKASFVIEITDVKDLAIAGVEARWKMGMVLL